MVTVLRILLLVWGGVSLAAVVTVAIVFALLPLGRIHAPPAEAAPAQDVRFVLNWCKLGDQRIEQVIHSYRAHGRDYMEAHAIRISHVEIAELTAGTDHSAGGWYRGDRLPSVLGDAVHFAVMWTQGEVPWFPGEAELRSGKVYVYPWAIRTHGLQTGGAELIFVRPADRMVFYFGGQM